VILIVYCFTFLQYIFVLSRLESTSPDILLHDFGPAINSKKIGGGGFDAYRVGGMSRVGCSNKTFCCRLLLRNLSATETSYNPRIFSLKKSGMNALAFGGDSRNLQGGIDSTLSSLLNSQMEQDRECAMGRNDIVWLFKRMRNGGSSKGSHE